ncbi:MAG: hypothetical protein ACLGIC_05195 [Acidimicrobiia bacterium]
MGAVRRRRRGSAVAVAVLVLAGCGGGAGGGPTTTAGEGTSATSTTTEPTTTTTGTEDDLAAAPPLDVSAAGLCDDLADLDLRELLSESLEEASPEVGAGAGCAYASGLTDEGAIQPDAEALVAVAEAPAEPDDDTVAGEAARGLPALEGLDRLGPSVGATAFEARNEYLDTWEAFAFVAVADGLVRLHLRDEDWEDEDDALDATVDLLGELGIGG